MMSNISNDVFVPTLLDNWYPDFHYVTNGIIIPVLGTVGLFGNAISAYIFLCRKITSPISPYFVALAFWDSVLLIASFILYSLSLLNPSFQAGSYVFAKTMQIAYPGVHIAFAASVWCLLVANYQRFHALALYNKRPVPCCSNIPYLNTALIGIASMLFNLPKWFVVDINEEKYSIGNTTEVSWNVEPSRMRISKLYAVLYHIICHLVFVTFGPSVCQAILMQIISTRLSQHSKQLRRSSTSQSGNTVAYQNKQNSTSRLLLMVDFKHMFCTSMTTVLDFLEVVLHAREFDHVLMFYLVDLSNLLVVLNCAVNFVVYFAYGAKFRREFKHIILCRWFCASRRYLGSVNHRYRAGRKVTSLEGSNISSNITELRKSSTFYHLAAYSIQSYNVVEPLPNMSKVLNGVGTFANISFDSCSVGDFPMKSYENESDHLMYEN